MEYIEFYEYDLNYPETSVLSKGVKRLSCVLMVGCNSLSNEDEERLLDDIKMFLRIYVQTKALLCLHNLQPFTVELKEDVCLESDNNIGCNITDVRCHTCEDNNVALIEEMIKWLKIYHVRYGSILLTIGTDNIPLRVIDSSIKEGSIDVMLHIRLLTQDSECDLYNLVARPYHHTMVNKYGNSDRWLKRLIPPMNRKGDKVEMIYDKKIRSLMDTLQIIDMSYMLDKLVELSKIDEENKDNSKLN